jgi:hypothetical protein
MNSCSSPPAILCSAGQLPTRLFAVVSAALILAMILARRRAVLAVVGLLGLFGGILDPRNPSTQAADARGNFGGHFHSTSARAKVREGHFLAVRK